eukprot:Cvel_1687.t2-p1 / transcript=Cvel_1687.t2 / gene=Cvel_1687 / organism=Chromera_velia_CCMP2878 / gene_product=Retrovirus-related Pol polyprotein from transposon, putative / transcript_product=Retrovirus-related Pol polyprotein from transposon, putative / location=Cvel_scaffold60:134955-138176(-) / protein_length=1074 / sequence_SO=supercontig / SO=protein_coding / is_pseudo=false
MWAQNASVKVGSQSKVSFVVGNGHKTTGILDSGAEVSFIDVSLTLYADSPVVPATLALWAAEGSGLKVLGETTISLSYPNNPEKKFPHILLVTADTGYNLVLGQDFLKLKDPVVQYHYRGDRLVVADLPVFHCWYDDGRKPMRVAPLRRTKVTKRSRALLRVDVDGVGEEETVILRRNFPRAHPGLAVSDQIVTVRAGVAIIEVLNVSQQDLRLGAEPLLTFAEPASRVASVTAITANVMTSTPPQNPPPSPLLPKVDLSHILPEVRGKYESLLREYSDLWSRFCFDIGELRLNGQPYEVRIPTGDAPPIRWNQDRVPYHQRNHVKKEIEAMEEGGVIRKSSSPWAAPVILVKKPDGTTRFCLDFRKLNQATKRDLFPLPRIQETLDRLTGAQVFSVLDYTSSFFQLKMHEADAEKTAFVTPFGLYEFTRMPFGLVNAPSIFQRVMTLLLAGLTRDIALVYIDDIIVFSRSHAEHLRDLREVLGLVRQANLKLKLEKAQIALREVEYLGYSVSFRGIRPSRKNVKKGLEWESPKDRKELRSFLYLCSYYRHFVADFARLTHPLHELLKPADKEGRPLPFQWGEEAEAIFTELKRHLTTPPILAFPDMNRPFIVKLDACKVSVGGLLTQEVNGKEVVIAYTSRALSAAERNYSPVEREALGLVYCCRQWRHYLIGGRTYAVTDHKPNLAMEDRKMANERVRNWALELQKFGLRYVHKSGKAHADADALSRMPQKLLPVCVDSGVPLCRHCNQPADRSTEIRTGMGAVMAGVYGQAKATPLQANKAFLDRVREELPKDPVLGDHYRYFMKGVVPTDKRQARQVLLEESAFEFRDGLLYRFEGRGVEKREQLVMPRACQSTVLMMGHDHSLGGHAGQHRLADKTLLHFWWPRLQADAREWVTSCRECQERAKRLPTRNPQTVPVPPHPWHTLGIDVSGPFPTSRRGNRFVLVVTDHFSKNVEAFARPEMTATVVAQILVDKIFCRYGPFEVLLSDRGINFRSELVSEVLRILKINHKLTSGYHPQCNGLTERYNQTWEQGVGKQLKAKNFLDWDLYLQPFNFSYRTTPHAETRLTPF